MPPPVPPSISTAAAIAGFAFVASLGLSAGCDVEARPGEGGHSVFHNLRAGEEPAPAKASVDPATYRWPTGPHARARILVAGKGPIEIELLPELAPATVANFEKLAAEGFFDGVAFHRVIAGFMLQTGDPNTRDDDPANDGLGGPGYTIADEFSDAPHVRGVVAMANTGRPNTSSSQFFIVHEDSPFLDGKYSVFGRVAAGLEVVDAIAAVATDRVGRFGPRDRPLEPVRIESIRVDAAPRDFR